MKKSGILNAALLGELAKLRHTDKFVICDAGFPIPKDGNVVDVSLTEGIPSFEQTLRAVVNEMVVEEYVAFSVMESKNPDCYHLITTLFQNQKSSFVTMPEFQELAKDAKLFIRTGELRPASNLLLVSASGTKPAVEKFSVTME